jgi:hypothetical protein
MLPKHSEKRLDQSILWTALSQRQYEPQGTQLPTSAQRPECLEAPQNQYEQTRYNFIRSYLLNHVDNTALDNDGQTGPDGERSIWSEFVEVLDDLHQVITDTGMETSLEGAVQVLTEATEDGLVVGESDSLLAAPGSGEDFMEEDWRESILIGYSPTELEPPSLPLHDRRRSPESGHNVIDGASRQDISPPVLNHTVSMPEARQTATEKEPQPQPTFKTQSPLSILVRSLADSHLQISKPEEAHSDQRFQEGAESPVDYAIPRTWQNISVKHVPERETEIDEATTPPEASRWSPDSSSQSSGGGWPSILAKQMSEWSISRNKRKRDQLKFEPPNSEKGCRVKLLRQLAKYEPAVNLAQKVRGLKRSGPKQQLAELEPMPAEASAKARKILGASEERRGRDR